MPMTATRPFEGTKPLDALDVHLGIVHAGAVPHIDGKLKHGEAIVAKKFAKKLVRLFVLLCFGRQVEENQYPHDAIFTQSVHTLITHYNAG